MVCRRQQSSGSKLSNRRILPLLRVVENEASSVFRLQIDAVGKIKLKARRKESFGYFLQRLPTPSFVVVTHQRIGGDLQPVGEPKHVERGRGVVVVVNVVVRHLISIWEGVYKGLEIQSRVSSLEFPKLFVRQFLQG